MRLSDWLAGALLVVIGIAVVLHARTFPAIAGQAVGPGLFPTLIGAGLVCGGIALAAGARRAPTMPGVEWDTWLRQPRAIRNVLFVGGGLVFYVLAAETLGFFPTGFVLLTVLFAAFGVSRRASVSLGIVTTLGLHAMFYTWLRVPLPWGLLERIAW